MYAQHKVEEEKKAAIIISFKEGITQYWLQNKNKVLEIYIYAF